MMAVLISLLCGCAFAGGALAVVLLYGAKAAKTTENNHKQIYDQIAEANVERARIANALESIAKSAKENQ